MNVKEPTINEQPFWNDFLHKIPLCNTLIEKSPEIKEEVMNFIREKNPMVDLPKYGAYDSVNKIQRENVYDHSWKAMPLSRFVHEFDESDPELKINVEQLARYAQENLPVTYGLIREYEQKGWLANTFISRLVPGSVIHPHRGISDLFLRVHLCLIEDPGCSITVGNETQTWIEHRLLSFKDGGPYSHSVLHAGKNERIILSMDLLISEMRQFIPGL
jgi:aspartyl/asparaginyl beta-hydroxylase (cupin superfamily)